MKHCKDCRVGLTEDNRRGGGRFCDKCRTQRGMCASDDPKYLVRLAGLHERYNINREQHAAYNKTRRETDRDQFLLKQKTAAFGVDCAALWAAQKGLCGVCQQPMLLGGKGSLGAQVDHDRSCCPGAFACGKCVRGFVHGHCNRVLAQSREDITILQGAIRYIQAWGERPTSPSLQRVVPTTGPPPKRHFPPRVHPTLQTSQDTCTCGHIREEHIGRGRNRKCWGAGATVGTPWQPVCDCRTFHGRPASGGKKEKTDGK